MSTSSTSSQASQPSRQATNPNRTGGPKTAEGKARSAANAVKHGLSARTHLPPSAAAAFEAEHNRWRRHLGLDPIHTTNPDATNINTIHDDDNDDDPEVALLAERVARIATTLRFARAADEAAQADRVRTARRDALAAIRDRVLALTESLHEPGRAEAVVAALMDTLPGLDWLRDRWRQLGHAIDTRGFWDADQMKLALALAGGPTVCAALTGWNVQAGGDEPSSQGPVRDHDRNPRSWTPAPLPFEMGQDRREIFREMRFEYLREQGVVPFDAVYDPVAALRQEEEERARALEVLKGAVARRLEALDARREEIEPLHEASLDEAEIRALIVVEGRGSSISRLRLENSLDLALHRTLKRIDLLRKEGRISPPRSTQEAQETETCAECENEPQARGPEAPEPSPPTAPPPSAPTTNPARPAPCAVQSSRSPRPRGRAKDRARHASSRLTAPGTTIRAVNPGENQTIA